MKIRGSEPFTSTGNIIYNNIKNYIKKSKSMPPAVRNVLMTLAKWARTTGSFRALPGMGVGGIFKKGRWIVRGARGAIVVVATVAVAIEGYCFTGCCQESFRNEVESDLANNPGNFL